MTAEELLAQLKPPRFYVVLAGFATTDPGHERWHVEWRRKYPDAISGWRDAFAPTLAEAVAAALAWEVENDRLEPEHAG
ncbi:MAG TPA: hypothetical protein VFJ24_08320 [Gaiellales bacterium]|nr:hypothetical protein [Gaiellales bacterium]